MRILCGPKVVQLKPDPVTTALYLASSQVNWHFKLVANFTAKMLQCIMKKSGQLPSYMGSILIFFVLLTETAQLESALDRAGEKEKDSLMAQILSAIQNVFNRVFSSQ